MVASLLLILGAALIGKLCEDCGRRDPSTHHRTPSPEKARTQYVCGYRRSDGTRVRGYHRRPPR